MVETKQVDYELSGTGTHPQDKRTQRIRARSSYLLFRQLYEFLKNKPDIADILRRFDDILDARRGFGALPAAAVHIQPQRLIYRIREDIQLALLVRDWLRRAMNLPIPDCRLSTFNAFCGAVLFLRRNSTIIL